MTLGKSLHQRTVSSSVRWVHVPLAVGFPERNEGGDGCSVAVPERGQ